jgi:hypothetical protein
MHDNKGTADGYLEPESSPVRPVQRPALDGLAEMAWLNVSSATQVRNHARYFKMRSCARAERPSRVIAFSSNFSPSAVIAQYLRIILGIISAFA